MGFYAENLLPHVINCACGTKPVEKQRAKIVPLARGRVLEIGMGSGLNLKHYRASQVDKIWGLEPSLGMRRKAKINLDASAIEVEWLDLPSEQIPLADQSMDTIVLTYTLCTIADVKQALAEMKRVLREDGRLLFSEHGLAPDARVRRWQQRINPLWRKLAGGCNLTRQIPHLISDAGFSIKELDQMYVPGPKIASYTYWGKAQKSR